jgi:hypothetical protein
MLSRKRFDRDPPRGIERQPQRRRIVAEPEAEELADTDGDRAIHAT